MDVFTEAILLLCVFHFPLSVAISLVFILIFIPPLTPFSAASFVFLSHHLCMTVSFITFSAHIHTLSRTLLSLQMTMMASNQLEPVFKELLDYVSVKAPEGI